MVLLQQLANNVRGMRFAFYELILPYTTLTLIPIIATFETKLALKFLREIQIRGYITKKISNRQRPKEILYNAKIRI